MPPYDDDPDALFSLGPARPLACVTHLPVVGCGGARRDCVLRPRPRGLVGVPWAETSLTESDLPDLEWYAWRDSVLEQMRRRRARSGSSWVEWRSTPGWHSLAGSGRPEFGWFGDREWAVTVRPNPRYL
jgi:hypothetical protein